MKVAKICFGVLFCILSSVPVMFAQSIDTVWTQNHWGGYFDSTNCIAETSDKGFIITGGRMLEGETNYDVLLIKTDSLGNLEWETTFGTDLYQMGFHVLETYDGGYLVSANDYELTMGGGGIWLIKTDASGDSVWTHSFLPTNGSGFPLSAVETFDSGIAVSGLVNMPGYTNDGFILKVDSSGTFVDFAHYGDLDYQWSEHVAQLPDSGFIMCGWISNTYTTGYDYNAIRVDKHLNIVWDSSYAITDYVEEVYGGCLLDDGYVIIGQARAHGHVLKVDFDGNTIWSKDISQYPTGEKFTSICPTPDGGLMAAGWMHIAGARRDYMFLRLDGEGNVLRRLTVGGWQDDHGNHIVPTSDSGYVIAGLSYSFVNGGSVYVVKAKEHIPPCCTGIRGNADNDIADILDVSDLLYLVDYMFLDPPGPSPACFEEADVNADAILDISDLLYLVDFMFLFPPGPEPLGCE